MVRHRKLASSKRTAEENAVAETALAETKTSDSVMVTVEEPAMDRQVKDEVEVTYEKVGNEKLEETNSEGHKVVKVDKDECVIMTEMNGDGITANHNAYEDYEIDDQEHVMWENDKENSEEDIEENVLSEYEVSEEDATEEDNGDESSEEDEEEEELEGGGKEAEEQEENTKEVNGIKNTKEEKGMENTKEEKGIAKGDEGSGEKHKTVKMEVRPKNLEKSIERGRKKLPVAERLKEVDPGDKPESSSKQKKKKRVESMGMVFMCSSKTKNDCYQYRVLGLPESKKDMVEKIYTGMRLFLYDVDLKLMYGIYRAAGPGGYNIEPKAFKSQFPSQVRFKVLDDCLPLAEEKFKDVLKDNYYTKTKFDCLLTAEQVKKLCRLFTLSSKVQLPKKLGRNRRAERVGARERAKRPRAVETRRLALREGRFREPPLKRRRKATSRSPLPLLSRVRSPVPSYAHERRALDVVGAPYTRDPYLERRNPRYRDGRDPVPSRVDPYRDVDRDPYLEERRIAYRDDPSYLERRRDTYREVERHDYRDSYLERRDYPDRYARDLYLESQGDPYRDGRDSYTIEHRGGPNTEAYITYRRGDPLLDRPRDDLYKEDRGVRYGDSSYRGREDLLERPREIQPLTLETRRYNDIGTARDSYISYGERPSYGEPIYSSRVGLAREYHI